MLFQLENTEDVTKSFIDSNSYTIDEQPSNSLIKSPLDVVNQPYISK